MHHKILSLILLLAPLLQAHAFSWAQGAQWIGTTDEDQCLYSPYLSVFRIDFDLKLSAEAHTASLLWGIDDDRLMQAPLNNFGLHAQPGLSWLRLDYTPTADSATISIYRKGYAPTDEATRPLGVFGVPRRVFHSKPASEWHHIALTSCFGETRVLVDGNLVASANLNPLGRGGDFIAYPVLGLIGLVGPEKGQAEVRQFAIGNYRSPQGTIARITELDGRCTPQPRVVNPSRHAMPLLCRVFSTEGVPAHATLHITARGIYDVSLNGRAVNHGYLNPGSAQYNRTQPFQTYDVTGMLRAGDNKIDVQLAEGWWMGASTYEGKNWNYFGDRLSMMCQLDITYADGHTQTILSNPGEWTYSLHSPVIYGSLFQGEVYDARRRPAQEAWKPCVAVGLEGHVSHEGWGKGPAPDDYTRLQYLETDGNDVDSIATLTALSVTEPREGFYVYDMGQNLVGVPLLQFRGLRRGQTVRVRYAEVLYPDMPEYAGKKGMLMLENIRAAMAQDLYVASGEPEETFSPRYTTHGFRYMELSGIDQPPTPADVKAIVLSSVHHTSAHYECSDSLVNRLWKNIEWSTRGNFLSIPTDCPQRNERMGWTGDISVFSPTATYLTTDSLLLRRFLRSMRDVQHADGRFPDIAPTGGGFGSFLWGSAGITVPWEMYCQWGDTTTLREHFPAMQRYMDYVARHAVDPGTGLFVQDHQWGDLADWLSPVYDQDDKSLIWEAYYVHCLDIMSKAATVLKHDREAGQYARLADARRRFFRATYLDPATGRTLASAFTGGRKGKPVDTEVSYALPIVFNIVEGEELQRLGDRLLEVLRRDNKLDNGLTAPPHTLLTGFIGTSWISRALSLCGHTGEAYRLLTQTEFPSWLYPVSQGATTIWERLDSYTHKNGFGGNNHMNSFNHYSFGAVGYWLMAHSLGIGRDSAHPGFDHIVWAPEADPTGRITHARGWYDTGTGRIESSWEVKGRRITYTLVLPAGHTATLRIKGLKSKELKAGRHRFTKRMEAL